MWEEKEFIFYVSFKVRKTKKDLEVFSFSFGILVVLFFNKSRVDIL